MSGVPRHAGGQVLICQPAADPEGQGLIERKAHDYLGARFCGRVLPRRPISNAQLGAWLALVNTRTHRRWVVRPPIASAPGSGRDAELAAGGAGPPGGAPRCGCPGSLCALRFQRLLGATRV